MNRSIAPRHSSRRPCLAGLVATALACGLGPYANAADRHGGEYPRLSRSAYWQAYDYDSATLALFHLDESGPQDIGDLDELDIEPAAGDGLPEGDDAAGPAGERRRNSTNTVPMGSAAGLLGDAALVAVGRFSGGVQVAGNGAIAIHGLSKSSARTSECWLKLESLPREPRVLMAANRGDLRHHVQKEHDAEADGYAWRLLLQPDGSIELDWAGKPTGWPGSRLAVDRWTHLALGITTEWPDGNAVHFFRDGAPVKPLTVDPDDAATAVRTADAIWMGADRAGRNGIAGCLDDIRVSRELRGYYEADLAWPDPERTIPVAQGRPFFRDAADLLFRAGFNKDLKPEPCAKNTRSPVYAVTQADEELSPGKVRMLFPPGVEAAASLMVGEGSLAPTYKGEGNLLPAQGSIAFWMQPLNWDNLTRDDPYDDVQPTVFGLFQIDGEYATGSYDRNFVRAGPLVEFNVVMNVPESEGTPVVFTPGRWTHIALTWEGTAFTSYVDGRRCDPGGAWQLSLPIFPGHDPRQAPHPDWWLNATPQAIRFGARRYWEQLKRAAPRTAIDDFRVYRRPLAASEVANVARLYDPRVTPAVLPEVELAMTSNGVSGRVTAVVTPLMAKYADSAEATVRVFKDGEEPPIGSAFVRLEQGKDGRLEVQTPPLEFTTYRVQAEVRDAASNLLGRAEQTFTRTQPPWWKSQAGLSDKVMPDWSPLRVENNVIHVADREIVLGPSGLPQRIVSLGDDVLAGPVTLEAEAAGKPLPLQAPAADVDVKAAGEVRADARGSLSGGGLHAAIASFTEFDGMMWFDVTLEPRAAGDARTVQSDPVAIDALTLRIPLKPASAEWIHWWSGERDFRDPKVVSIGRLPEDQGVLFRSNDTTVLTKVPTLRGSFIPYLLLTGDRHGLAWFAENDRGWTQSDDVPAVSVERTAEAVTLLLRIVSSPITLDGPRRFAFGLQPTPVKARDRLWRRYPGYSNVFPDTFSGNGLKGRGGASTFSLYPEDDWAAVRSRIDGAGLGKGAAGLKGLYAGQLARLAKQGITAPPPQSLTVPGLYWDMQWNGIPPSLTHTREWAETWATDYQHYTPAFVDFCSWAWNDWVGKTEKFVAGAYIDDCWGAPSTKADGPTTYALPDGHIQPGFQFLGPRERFKRMRQISWDQGVWPHITAHTTHTFFVPYHAFFDLILDGEDHYSEPSSQADFIDHWSLDRLRFMHNAKWGLVTTWLGWCGNSCPTATYPAWTFRQTRAYVAGLALHDIAWGFDDAVLRRFGLREPDTEFIPYWDNATLIAENSQPDAIKVGAWKRDGRYLLLVVNVGADRAASTLRLNLPAETKIRDADPSLLTYFAEDATAAEKPQLGGENGTEENLLGPASDDDADFSLEVPDTELPLAERRAKDPDGTVSWQNGVLTCPVRRHDFRLFELEPAEGRR